MADLQTKIKLLDNIRHRARHFCTFASHGLSPFANVCGRLIICIIIGQSKMFSHDVTCKMKLFAYVDSKWQLLNNTVLICFSTIPR